MEAAREKCIQKASAGRGSFKALDAIGGRSMRMVCGVCWNCSVVGINRLSVHLSDNRRFIENISEASLTHGILMYILMQAYVEIVQSAQRVEKRG